MSDNDSYQNGGDDRNSPIRWNVEIRGCAREVDNIMSTRVGSAINVDRDVPSDNSDEIRGCAPEVDNNMSTRVGSPIDVDLEVPSDNSCSLTGTKAKTWEELYQLYKQHSRLVGFSVRKSTTRKSGNDGPVTEKYFVCSCEGFAKGDSKVIKAAESVENGKNKRKRKRVPRTRTGCGDFMRVKANVDGAFEVVNHVVAHNHEMTRPELHHLHRASRKISKEESEVIQVMTEARVPPAVQFRYMAHSCGGEEEVGHSKKDHYNHVYRKKMKVIEVGDSQAVLDFLHKRAEVEPDFFFRVKLDDDGRLCSVFWRDSMMKEDYLLYRDVMVFDTTYRTNKYNLICGAFVGINNHWSNVMFGCAFLANEKTESFEWLFNVFNESMAEDVYPTTIFTDQDCNNLKF